MEACSDIFAEMSNPSSLPRTKNIKKLGAKEMQRERMEHETSFEPLISLNLAIRDNSVCETSEPLRVLRE